MWGFHGAIILIFDSILVADTAIFCSYNRIFLTPKPCNFSKSPLSAPLYTLKKHGTGATMDSEKSGKNYKDVSCF